MNFENLGKDRETEANRTNVSEIPINRECVCASRMTPQVWKNYEIIGLLQIRGNVFSVVAGGF
jgi:hypothetical protein